MINRWDLIINRDKFVLSVGQNLNHTETKGGGKCIKFNDET